MYDPTRMKERPTATSESTYSTFMEQNEYGPMTDWKIEKQAYWKKLIEKKCYENWMKDKMKKNLDRSSEIMKKGPKLKLLNAYNMDANSVIQISITTKKTKPRKQTTSKEGPQNNTEFRIKPAIGV